MTVRSFSSPTYRSQLSSAQRRLLDLIDHVWFGRIEDLCIRSGEPSFDHPPRVIRTLKIAGQVDPQPSQVAGDRPLTTEQNRLLSNLATLQNATVRRIEVSHAIPLFVEVYDEPRPTAD